MPHQGGFSPDVKHIVYTPAQFRATFDWKNDPHQAILMALPE